MSLIQAALEKANRARLSSVKPPESSAQSAVLFDEGLEKELRGVQRQQKVRRLFRWTIAAGAGLLAVAALGFMLRRDAPASRPEDSEKAAVAATAVPKVLPSPFFSSVAFRLSGITDLGDKPRAVINDQIVSVGDRVSRKAVVKEIRADGVLLEVHGKDFELTL